MRWFVSLLIILLIVLIADPAQGHTAAEEREWKTTWVKEVQSRGLTRQLLHEYLVFEKRHAPRQVSIQSGVSRGIGSGVEQWRSLVAVYFSTETDLALCIMSHESGGNPNALNPSSGAAGLFQIMPFWWDKFGGDRYDPETNVSLAATIRGLQGWSAWSPWNRGACR